MDRKEINDLSVICQFTKTLAKLDLCEDILPQALSARIMQLEIQKLMEVYNSVQFPWMKL